MLFESDKNKKTKRRLHFPTRNRAENYVDKEKIPSDVLGSYSGVPYENEDDEPVQDVDDL